MLLEEGAQRLELRGVHGSAYHGHGLAPVVRTAGVAVRLVPPSSPVLLIDLRYQGFALEGGLLAEIFVAHQGCIFRGGTEQDGVPGVVQKHQVLVLAPVPPVGDRGLAFCGIALHDQPVRTGLPQGQVFLELGIDVLQGSDVSGVEVIFRYGKAEERRGLGDQLPVVVAGRGTVHGAVLFLEAGKFADSLPGQGERRRAQGIEGLDRFVCGIAYPLAALAVGAVEEVVAHVDVKGPCSAFPQGVEERIAAFEGAGEEGVIAALTELYLQHFHSFGDAVMDLHAVHPHGHLMLLDSLAGSVLRAGAQQRERHEPLLILFRSHGKGLGDSPVVVGVHFFRLPALFLGSFVDKGLHTGVGVVPGVVKGLHAFDHGHAVKVGVEVDDLAFRSLHLDVGSDLAVVREGADEFAALHAGGHIFLEPVVFPLRYGAPDAAAPASLLTCQRNRLAPG